jgi:hypothetical protein
MEEKLDVLRDSPSAYLMEAYDRVKTSFAADLAL